MAQVYSTRFISAPLEPAGLTYTVPDGYVAILRDFDAVGTGGESVQFTNLDAGATYFLEYFPGSGYGNIQWRGRQVVPAGETIAIYVSGASSGGTASLSGYLHTLDS